MAQAIALPQFPYDGKVIIAESAVIESWSQVIRAPTSALVHPDDVESCRKGFRRHPSHIVRIGRSFKAMNQEDGWCGRGVILPMTKAEKLGAWLSREETFTARKVLFPSQARPISRNQRHQMRVSEQQCGVKSVEDGHTLVIIAKSRSGCPNQIFLQLKVLRPA